MMQRAAGGRTGRIGLYKEIDDIANDPEKATVVLAAVLDVADSGGISPQEQSVIDNIAQRLKLDPSKLT
jgi:tellurite resistance protein